LLASNEVRDVCLDQTLRIKGLHPPRCGFSNLLRLMSSVPSPIEPGQDRRCLKTRRAGCNRDAAIEELEIQGFHLRRIVALPRRGRALVGVASPSPHHG